MSSPIIEIKNLSKKYTIGVRAPYGSLREEIMQTLTVPFNRFLSKKKQSSNNTIWALKDVSFQVKQGDVIGIIGRNGAGKSTLLKILSRITEPTKGEVRIRGRVGSLLEVGTGFHPELTGRENIFLNGALLGMRKEEIKKKFNGIVAFAEIEKFLDTPVKRYSSGMYVRLAFAVAAHLEPEILLVDEVLAVGDIQFQQKCLGKMGDVAKEGRTVLFVSHQMGAIAQLCSKAIILSKGSIVKAGDTRSVIDYYLSSSSEGKTGFTVDANCGKDMFIAEVKAANSKGELTSHFSHQEEIIISSSCKINKWLSNVNVGFFVRDARGRRIFTSENREWDDVNFNNRELFMTITIPSNFLVPGRYFFTFFISVPKVRFVDWVEDVLAVTIVDTGSKFLEYEGGDYGCVFTECKWDIKNV